MNSTLLSVDIHQRRERRQIYQKVNIFLYKYKKNIAEYVTNLCRTDIKSYLPT
jgi:hypothetical protein